MQEPATPVEERRIFRFFEISVLLKGANAVLELVGGALALLVPPEFIRDVAAYFTNEELGQDPHDFVATHILQLANVYATGGHQLFAALYLLSHGAVKLVLVVALLKNKLWAYPAALVVFGLFILYQGYLFILEQSVGIALITIFDFIVMWFVWREYRVVKAHAH